LRLERRQAATVYIDSSLAYIQNYVKKGGASTQVIAEGGARLGDLRDVATNYPELMKKLRDAQAAYAVALSTSTPDFRSIHTSDLPKSGSTIKQIYQKTDNLSLLFADPHLVDPPYGSSAVWLICFK